MPRPDPFPGRTIRRRVMRILRVAAAVAIVIAAIAVLMVARGQPERHVHMLIATALGIGLTVLLGAALVMVFLSHRSAHDSAAANPPHESDEP